MNGKGWLIKELEVLRQSWPGWTMANAQDFRQDSLSSGRYLIPVPPKYEPRVFRIRSMLIQSHYSHRYVAEKNNCHQSTGPTAGRCMTSQRCQSESAALFHCCESKNVTVITQT
jgi:hypothetical protein